VESSCEFGNEPSGSIKCWESTEWLHNLWPLEWYSAPQSQYPYIFFAKIRGHAVAGLLTAQYHKPEVG
jgi:hypothetical protein